MILSPRVLLAYVSRVVPALVVAAQAEAVAPVVTEVAVAEAMVAVAADAEYSYYKSTVNETVLF